jgi:hypothetical protein
MVGHAPGKGRASEDVHVSDLPPFATGDLLLAMNPNTLLYPEGDRERRRHAHTACVVTERKSGDLLTKAEWELSQRPPKSVGRSWWRRLFDSRRAD